MNWTDEDYKKAIPYFMRNKFVKPRDLVKNCGIHPTAAHKMINSLKFERWSDHKRITQNTVYIVPKKYRKR